MSATNYEVDKPTHYWVIAIFNWIRYVTLRPWPLTPWPWSHVTWCHFGCQYLCQVWDVFDLPFQSYDDYNFPLTANYKSQFSRFWGLKGVKFQISSF